ncbi:MAG: dihydropteroate synthase [Elusimicrobia bacterium]|nr:dihydropteroate synthase [Elusimicrobiota bacterium]
MKNQTPLHQEKLSKELREHTAGSGMNSARMSMKPTVMRLDLQTPAEVERCLASIPVDPAYRVPLISKCLFTTILIKNIDNRASNILKQEMLRVGGEACVSRNVSEFKQGQSDLLCAATDRQYEDVLRKLALQPYGLKNLCDEIKKVLSPSPAGMLRCKTHRLDYARQPVIMGILNITPDSFHDGGMFLDQSKAIDRGMHMAEEGAAIIDVGGESTRPGADYIDEDEEKKRIIPVIEALAKNNILVSVDTRKSSVARAALNCGASIVNDVSALRDDSAMAALIAETKAGVVLMHMRGPSRTMQVSPFYQDVTGEVFSFFRERIDAACSAGIDSASIIIDPGIGFGKTLEHNSALIRHLRSLQSLMIPIMLGASRKSMIEKALKTSNDKSIPTTARLPGSLALAVVGLVQGARFFRVHDVSETKQALTVAAAVWSS